MRFRMKKFGYQGARPQEGAGKLLEILEKNASFPESTGAATRRYLKKKKEQEERMVLVDGEYRDKDDLDGQKAKAAERREERKKRILIAAGILILVGAVAMCVLTAKGINPIDNLKIQTLSKFHFRF